MQESAKSSSSGWRKWWKSIAIGTAALILNMLMYALLPTSLVSHLGRLGYVSAFVVATIANASVILPIPYYPLIIRLSQTFNVWGVILTAASGSVIGELISFFIGRTSHAVIRETQFSNWIERQIRVPCRVGPLLFGLAAIPNPAFDIAGLLAGALDVSVRMFVTSVFLGRIVRMGLVALVGLTLQSI